MLSSVESRGMDWKQAMLVIREAKYVKESDKMRRIQDLE